MPGDSAVSNAASDWRVTRICWAASWGWPSVCPKGNSTASVRGTPIFSAQKGIGVTRIVDRPAASSVRASTGTLMEQSGQAGVSSTQSTPSALNLSATLGP